MRAPGILIAAFGALALSGCATPETRLRTGLMDAGISQPVAACMADRMVDRLSLGQLMKIAKLKKLKGGEKNWRAYLKNTRALQDPEILAVTTSSGVICAVTG